MGTSVKHSRNKTIQNTTKKNTKQNQTHNAQIKSTLILILALLFTPKAIPCSSFLMLADNNRPIFSKNYDWKISEGYIIANPRGLNKKSFTVDSTTITRWTSKYSSITFNQYGAELPNGGINEKGLMIEVLWLEQSQYEATDTRPALNELQWIQYQLDQYLDTKEVVKNLNNIRIQNIYGKVHYLVCDKSKNCATIEYLEGSPTVHTGKDLPYSTMTNSTYEKSKLNIEKFEGFGGTQKIPMKSYGSLDRFARINLLIKNYLEAYDPIEYAYSILNSVRNDTTQWQVVYDPSEKSIYFRTNFVTTVTGLIETEDLFKNCKQERYYFDLATPLRGQVKSFFKPLTAEANKKLITLTLGKLMGNPAPELIEAASTSPFKMTCSL